MVAYCPISPPPQVTPPILYNICILSICLFSYILTAKLGETITIEGKVLKIGRNIAFAEAEFRRKSDNALIAKGKITLALLNHLKSTPKRTTRVGPVG